MGKSRISYIGEQNGSRDHSKIKKQQHEYMKRRKS
uniref:Uncharacterized protein n=1 Tax=Rhizophora mucronata TaxID=61149 RepID=A0A2P2MXC8_RHIMU